MVTLDNKINDTEFVEKLGLLYSVKSFLPAFIPYRKIRSMQKLMKIIRMSVLRISFKDFELTMIPAKFIRTFLILPKNPTRSIQ